MKSKKILSVALSFVIIVLSCFSLTACDKKVEGSVLTIWIGGSVVGEDEVEESQDSWIVQELVNEYAKQFNVSVKLTYFEDEEAMVQLVANNGRSGNEVPDIACVYSSEILRDMSDVLYPLKKYITDEEKEHIMFWETVTDNGRSIEESNEVYGYPIGGTEVTFIAYNKSLFKKAGLDVEKNPPATFDEFELICETLAQNGILPIVASDDGWNELYVQLFAKEWMQFVDDPTIISEAKGELPFSNDKHLLNSLHTMAAYYSKGYINQDYATNEDATTLFANGKAAMFSCSNYDINLYADIMGDDFGALWVPDYSGDVVRDAICFGGCNQCFSVTKDSRHKDEAIALIQWMSNKENNIRIAQKFGCFPNRNDIALEEYDNNASEVVQIIYPLLPYAHCTADYLMPMNVYTEFYRRSLSVVIGEMTPEEFGTEMDEITNVK